MTNQRDAAEAVAIKPCPFCGSPGKMIGCMGNWRPEGYEPDGCRITCSSDVCSGLGVACYGADMESNAIAFWNKRASLPAASEGEPVAYRYIVHTPDGKKRALTAHKCTHWDGYPISDETPLYDHPAPSDQVKLDDAALLADANAWYSDAQVEEMARAKSKDELIADFVWSLTGVDPKDDTLRIDHNELSALITRARQNGS